MRKIKLTYFFILLTVLFLPISVFAVNNPTFPSVSPLSACGVKFSWNWTGTATANTKFNVGYQPLVGGYKTISSGQYSVPFPSSSITSYIHTHVKLPSGTGLKPGSPHKYAIHVQDGGNYSSWAPPHLNQSTPPAQAKEFVSVSTPDISSPPTPPNITKAEFDASGSSILVEWGNVSFSTSYGGFELERNENGAGFQFLARLPTTASSFPDPTALPDNYYQYRLKTFESDEYCTVSFITPDPSTDQIKMSSNYSNTVTVPSRPNTLSAVSDPNDGTKAIVSWVDNSNSSPNTEDQFEIIYYPALDPSLTNSVFVSANITSLPLTNLAPDTHYNFKVRAKKNNAGSPGFSAFSPAPDGSFITKMSNPTNFSAVVVSINETVSPVVADIYLQWDDISPTNTGYVLERSTISTYDALLVTEVDCYDIDTDNLLDIRYAPTSVDASFCRDKDVSLGPTYYYWIKAENTNIPITAYSDLIGPVSIDLNISPFHGFAWSDNIGWIDFNCTADSADDTNKCPPANTGGYGYVVYMNNDTNNLGGYAWNDSIGWINFDGGHIDMTINAVTGQPNGAVTGTARACAVFKSGCSGDYYGGDNNLTTNPYLGGWDGFIYLSDNTNSYFNSPVLPPDSPEGVTYNSSTNELIGYAWGDMNVGLISFNRKNCDGNNDLKSDGTPVGCPPAGTSLFDYKVTFTPINTSGGGISDLDLKVSDDGGTTMYDTISLNLSLLPTITLYWNSPSEKDFTSCSAVSSPVYVDWDSSTSFIGKIPTSANVANQPFSSGSITLRATPSIQSFTITCDDGTSSTSDIVYVTDLTVPALTLSYKGKAKDSDGNTTVILEWESPKKINFTSCSASVDPAYNTAKKPFVSGILPTPPPTFVLWDSSLIPKPTAPNSANGYGPFSLSDVLVQFLPGQRSIKFTLTCDGVTATGLPILENDDVTIRKGGPKFIEN